ncbi:MAG: rod shape-determining protein MreC [Methylotenera sp.]|nr:MAG: rod shape-determining protein MreC [Methylotenera sp.]
MALGFNHKLEQQQEPAFFVRGPSPLARLVFFSALSLALIATDSRLQYLSTVRQHLVAILHPLQVIANAPSQLYQNVTEYFSTQNRLVSENKQLRQQALENKVALQKLNTLTLENSHLRGLLKTNQALAETSVLGEVMYVGRDLFRKKNILNRGTQHQIIAGQAVVDATGVIGQVTRVFPYSSEVTLITDKALAIPVQIERNGLRAIAFGRGRDNTLDIPYLPANVDIKTGDKLVTSGIDGVYPAGLAVATVTKITATPDSAYARITCTPTGGIENHRHVLIVSMPIKNEVPSQEVETSQNTLPTSNKKESVQTKIKKAANLTEKPIKPNATQ